MANITKHYNPIKMELDYKPITEKPREYLGFSSIGSECRRKIWYGWRWATPKILERRMVRLLNRGHAEESIIISDLESMGMVISNTQAELTHTIVGKHSQGHIDGEVENVPYGFDRKHLLEMKTMKDDLWRRCDNEGVEKSHYEYYAQFQIYMHYRKLEWTLFVATNKNNDKRIYQRIPYEESVGREMHKRVTDIIFEEEPPMRIVDDPAFYICHSCKQKNVCYGKTPPQINCRTCLHATVADDGVWECATKHQTPRSSDEQIMACTNYTRLF